MSHDHSSLTTIAENLVRERITGARKGLPDQPKYLHSFRVSAMLHKYNFDEETCLAGLLHDVIEDGGVTVKDLRDLGFSDNVINLVQLCTHNIYMTGKDLRWILMIVNLAKADLGDAWAIKLADVFDNFLESYSMSKERSDFMRDIKIPTLLNASMQQIGSSKLWVDLNSSHTLTVTFTREIEKQVAYVHNEVNNTLNLSEEAKNAVLRACGDVSDSNYGLNNPALLDAISTLADLTEKLSGDENTGIDRVGLSILVNESCGNMLSLLLEEKRLAKVFRGQSE